MAGHRLSQGKQAIVLVMVCWGILTIAPDLWRPFGHYGTLGFEADNDGHIEQVDNSIQAHPTGCIQTGDWIEMRPSLLPSRGLLAVFGGMGGMQYVRTDQVAQLSIAHARDGPAHPCQIHAVKLSGHQANLWPHVENWPFWLPILAEDALGILFIALCARIVWQHQSPAAWGFFLYGLWFNPGQYFAFYSELQRWPVALVLQEVAQALFQSAGYIGFIVFALTFPNRPVSPGWQPLYRSLPILGGVLAVLQLASFASAFGIRTEAVTDWSYIAGILVDAGVWLILLKRYQDMDPIARQRTRWVLWGCAVGLTAFIFADVYEATSMLSNYLKLDERQLAFFYMANALVALAVYVAIRRYRVFDVHFKISRWTILLIIGVVGVALFREVEHFLDKKYDNVTGLLPVGVLMVLGGEKLRERLNETCNKLFFRRLHETRAHLDDIKDKFEKSSDYDEVDGLLVNQPVCCLEIASAAVFRRQGPVFRRQVPAVAWPEGTGIEFPADIPTAMTLSQTRHPLRFEDDRSLPIVMPADVDQPVLAVPICNADELVAIAVYGAHREGDNILREEVRILQEMAEAAAIGYARSETHHLRLELEKLQHGKPPPEAS